MDVGPFVVADAQAAKLIQPRKRPLHDPALAAQTTAMLGAAHRPAAAECGGSHTMPNALRVISAIAEHAVGPTPGPPSLAL